MPRPRSLRVSDLPDLPPLAIIGACVAYLCALIGLALESYLLACAGLAHYLMAVMAVIIREETTSDE